jgi:hypothetical protein
VQNFTSSTPFEFSSIAALNRASVTDGWTIILRCCAASNARSSADLSLKAEWGLGGGLVRLLRKFAINEINPLIDRSLWPATDAYRWRQTQRSEHSSHMSGRLNLIAISLHGYHELNRRLKWLLDEENLPVEAT